MAQLFKYIKINNHAIDFIDDLQTLNKFLLNLK